MGSLVWSVKPTLVPEVGKPEIDLERVVNLAVDEFINSRPWPFRKLAKWGSEKGRKDIVLVTKNAATFAQITFAFSNHPILPSGWTIRNTGSASTKKLQMRLERLPL
jgi:hypothetical protein